MNPTTIDFGILGAGTIALDHARVAVDLGHRVVAGSTRSPESPRWARFKEEFGDTRFVADGRRLLEDDGLDALIVCLGWESINEWLPALLRCPKPMILEKPLGLDSATLAAALDGAGANLDNKIVGMNRRFYAPLRRLARRISEGGLKAVEIAHSEDIGHLIERFGQGFVPHVMVSNACHILDLACHLLGPLTIRAMYGFDEADYGTGFRSCHGLLETAGGVPVVFAFHADDPIRIGIRCRFNDHTVWHLSPLEALRVYKGYDIEEPTKGMNIRRYVPRCVEETVAEATFRPGFREQMAAFARRDFTIAARPRDALRLTRLIEDIQSAAAG